jgi:hypothetical protein
MRHFILSGVALVLYLTTHVATAEAHGIRRVPTDHATIQAAVDAAEAGDLILVRGGAHCGATITKEVHLVALWNARIVGCAAPANGLLRIGFFLPDERASGTTIHGFAFDGEGIADDDLEPLAFAVLARDAHDVQVVGTRVRGTVQAISNTNGDGWLVAANVIRDLGLFGCPGFCGGGVGVVMQNRLGGDETSWGNKVIGNLVSGAIPDGHEAFAMVGVFVLAQDRPLVAANVLRIPANPEAGVEGIGVHVANTCCGLPEPFPFTERAVLVGNDGRCSELVLVVDPGNADGAVIHGNRGVERIEGVTRTFH